MSTVRQILAWSARDKREFLVASSGHGSPMRLDDGWKESEGMGLTEAWAAVAHWESHADTIGGTGIAVHRPTMMAVDERAFLSLGPGNGADAFGYVSLMDDGPFFKFGLPPKMSALALDLTPLLGLAERASNKPMDESKLRAIMARLLPPAGEDPNYRELVGGYRVVFTVEQHPMGWARHVSVSAVDPMYADARMGWCFDIHEQPVSVVMAALGFSGTFRDAVDGSAVVYTEMTDRFLAVNVIQPIK